MASVESSNTSEPTIKAENTADTTAAATTVTNSIDDNLNIKKEPEMSSENRDDSTDNATIKDETSSQQNETSNDTNNNKGDDQEQNNIDNKIDKDDAANNEDDDETTAVNDNNESLEESNENKTNLIVNYLPQLMTDEEFEKLFEKFGKMKSCKIVRNRASGYSYGFGFVDFETHEQAIKAIDELNGHELENKKIKVAFARPAGQDIKQANLYIKNIPTDWTQEQVRSHFDPYGNIIQVRVLGNNRGVAFVLYDLRKQAEDALEALNGKTIEGCSTPLEIKFAADKKSEKTSSNKSKSGKSGDNSSNNDNASANEGSSAAGGPARKRERGHRGGRNHRLRMERRNQRAAAANNDSSGKPGGGGSYFDRRQNDNRQQRGQNRFNNNRNNHHNNNISNNMNNPSMYAGGMQYGGVPPFNNQMNGIGPMRQQVNKMNRYTPFVPLQPMMGAPAQAVVAPNHPTSGPMAAQTMTPNPAAMAYGYPAQQSMIPYGHMMQAQPQMGAATHQMHHQMTSQATAGQITQTTPMGMYSAATTQLAHHPMAHYMMQTTPAAPQAAINNIYNVASNTMTNAANMQPQLGQPMGQHMRSGGGGDDGVTLFVYNIGPDSDESELRSMFGPYGQVVKCNVVRKTPGGETKGFGFVTMKDRDQANGAIAGLNGSMRNGRALQVSLKK